MNTATLIILGIVGLTFFVLNIIFLAIIFFMRRKAMAVSQWPSTMGTILTSELERRRSSSGSGSVLYPVVLYSYRVMGRDYQGNVIAPGLAVGGSGAPKVVERYPSGSQVTVYYDPQNPVDAVLEQKAPAMFWMWFILILLDCILFGTGVPMFFLFGNLF